MKKTTTGDMTFNGMTNGKDGGYNSKYQHTADGIPAPKSNYGRGPTKGNTDGKTAGPATASGSKQYRGVGGTKVPSCSYDINVGRGPTKGNS